jgi:hypothetical protein
MSRYVTSSKNSNKPRSRPGNHEAIAAIDNPFLEHTRLHLPPDVSLTLLAFPLLTPAGVVSSSTTLQRLDYSDNVSSAFLLIHKIVHVNSIKSPSNAEAENFQTVS